QRGRATSAKRLPPEAPFACWARLSVTQERPMLPRTCAAVMRRALSPSLVVAAVLADAQGGHRLSFYLLFAAIPALAVATMDAFGDYLEGSSPIHAWMNGLALVLVVFGTALRAPSLQQGTAPAGAPSGLVLA